MRNAAGSAAWEYHLATNHSPQSVAQDRFGLDWPNQPRPFKLYPGLEPIPLPASLPRSDMAALDAIAATGPSHPEAELDLATLTAVLGYSAGIMKLIRFAGGSMPFRAASCTGALYHIEMYIACGPLGDLEAGVYQLGVHDFALRRIRAGDYRAALVDATSALPAVADAPAIVVCTSVFWRNAWKYRARTYRHAFWDSGTILANLLAMAHAHHVRAQVVAGFVDETVNRLVDVDGAHEAAIALVALGYGSSPPPVPSPPAPPLHLVTAPYSATEIEYPAIQQIAQASSLETTADVAAWRAAVPTIARPAPTGELVALRPIDASSHVTEPIETVIRRRGSSRAFLRTPIGFDALSTMLAAATSALPADFLPAGLSLNDLYVIVNAVEGLASGSYVLHREQGALDRLRAGEFREVAGHLDLGQELAADAAVNVYFLADLRAILPALGNRGYRAAQLEAAIMGGKLYLAAYALGLGATGLTFFDDEVTAFFSPHAAGKSVMFLMAIGNPARRPR